MTSTVPPGLRPLLTRALHSPGNAELWWQSPNWMLRGRCPREVWKVDPKRVWELASTIAGDAVLQLADLLFGLDIPELLGSLA